MASNPAAERLLEAAHRAREDAEVLVVRGDFDATDELFHALKEADDILDRAASRIRQATRPLSAGTLGEKWDDFRDWTDKIRLRSEAEDGEAPDVSERVKQEDEWTAFVDLHPELSKPPAFSDAEIVDALRSAIETRERPWSRGATTSSDVVCVLLPGVPTVKDKRATPIVTRAGKQLARLAREGRVVRLRAKWTKGKGRSAWSLEGFEIGEWWLKQYEVDDDAR
jgi:hypothetical protein